MKRFTIFKGKKKVKVIEAKDLEDAEKKANKEYPNWTEIYIGVKTENW